VDELKPDWREACDRMRSWWRGQPIDRAVALVRAPRKDSSSPPPITKVPDKYTDPDTVFHNVDAALSNTFYGGEAFPSHWVYMGPVPMSFCVGCKPHFDDATVWYATLYERWEEVDDIHLHTTDHWYQILRDLTRESMRRCGGRYMVSGQGFGCVSDIVANLWGTEQTLTAMVERPDAIEAATRKLTDISKQLYDEFDTITASQDGSIDWLGIWSPGRIWSLQSDMCCMISPAMFEAYVLEELREEARHVDHAFYHLDGPDAIKHLDALLSIEELGGIQWVPGAGASRDPLDWIPLFRRIQGCGKKIQIACPPDRVTPLLKQISPRGVCLNISCPNPDAAEDVLRNLDRIGT